MTSSDATIRRARLPAFFRAWADVQSLLLAVEIISPSSVRADRITKRDFYLDVGVPEYWAVDLDARIVERWVPERDTPRVESGRFEWCPAGSSGPLVIDAAALFDHVAGNVRRI